ncbi:MAG: phosphotransferase family protein [Holophagaceae bacterium]|nr:phosphotransferase family protein [Holophagaceae bacterium]
MPLVDESGPIRPGEELDILAADAFLKRMDPTLMGTPAITQFPGGASNLTYLVRYDNRELVLRRPPFGHKAKSAHDMGREARIMAALKPHYPFVPEVLAVCEDLSFLGSEFYVMERIRGLIPRQDLPDGLDLNEADTRKLCLNVLDKLIELHQVDWKSAGLESLGKGEGYVQRQIAGWSDRYRKARTENAVDFESVMAWLAANMPTQDSATCLIHNDFRFDNVVLDPEHPINVIGVLDWEMATLGDPLMDLGNSLAYWVQADDDETFKRMRRQPTHLPGMLTRQEAIDYYAARTGRKVDDITFYLIYGLFRLAVIVQQIYYRYHHGQTTNPAFKGFIHITNYLEQRCLKLIAASKV